MAGAGVIAGVIAAIEPCNIGQTTIPGGVHLK
jgi:hypothetical protein